MKISQNFVAFLEYMNFIINLHGLLYFLFSCLVVYWRVFESNLLWAATCTSFSSLIYFIQTCLNLSQLVKVGIYLYVLCIILFCFLFFSCLAVYWRVFVSNLLWAVTCTSFYFLIYCTHLRKLPSQPRFL